MKGHPHWPAAVSSIDSKNKLAKYNVTFYGTGEVDVSKKLISIFVFGKQSKIWGFKIK